ncbi:hypothetical protein G3480_20455 [Thiorhodococcus mannitoliphagus]|uniref:Pentapeptide MXKDX repeat protein n=1 Tax=Thiorhodococcus mannitoliphagus TaxID=329406 RepID=A0A6P1DWT5_9GAMM|nr:hypothetical protein [Thiorhodococcus mannitoliphagus]NEX22648.1 hypothetical protein [Thiorhodococcus mannitoliphagus]
MRIMTSCKTITFFAAFFLFAGTAFAEGLSGMAQGAMMDSMKEKAIDQGSEMATDQAKSAMGLKGDADEAKEDESESEAKE